MTLWEAIDRELERLAPKCAYPKDYPWATADATKLREALVHAAKIYRTEHDDET